MENALYWLINNNPHYKDVQINQESLDSLPENGVPQDLTSVETENDDSESTTTDFGPQNDEDIIYNQETEMSSFLPIAKCSAAVMFEPSWSTVHVAFQAEI